MHRHRPSRQPALPSLQPHHPQFQRRTRTLVLAGIALAVMSALFVMTDSHAAGSAAVAASASASNAFDARYRKERAACDDGTTSNQDRTACLKEAGAAKAESRKGTLADGASPQTREVNAVARCNALPARDRTDCMARIDGPGGANQKVTTSGSVAGGGVIRETVSTVRGTPASAGSSSSGSVGAKPGTP